jgi:2-aminoethylphosphonate-pyruvate transaminase
VIESHGKSLVVDAMSSFGALPIDARTTRFDALIAASGKCIEGPPGMGFVLVRKSVLEKCAGNSTSLALDLHDQWVYMEKTTQWRYTPPTHVVVAFNAALDQHVAEGGQPARLARYKKKLRHAARGNDRDGIQALPEARDPSADHPHVPRAPRSGVQLQGVLRARARQGLHPLSGQAHGGGDVPRRLHRRDRPGRNAPGR